ncbi:glycosyltransferase [Aestuariivivens insulae]|uniref:glycosyltransferase n=1 Tax=Aestuariivivens insulae TaxID=1621988 RepID=UPI001F59E0E7|nr:glycosyltransferase [Aestuariivivens insulae]
MGKKKVLIITYYWPPAGGPGVQRWLKFVKYLPDFNIEPIVYIPENPSYPLIDESLASEVSKDIIVLCQPIKEPYRLAGIFSKKTSKTISKGIISEKKRQGFIEKLMLYIRGNYFIPDARIGWVKPSVTFLSKYIRDNNIETIITTGPPHSLHLIGLQLKRTTGVRWLADFRDPWTTIGYHKHLRLTKRAQLKHKAMEREVLNSADQIIVTSEVTKTEFGNISDKPISVITNGYDYEPLTDFSLDKKFTLSHIGSLLSKRNPKVLWQVLFDISQENKSFANDFQLNLVGAVSDDVLKSIENHGLSDYINKVGYVSHKESVKRQKQSQVLLLIEIDSEDTKSIIPGKLFEYMVSNRPIIALGPKGSDVERIIKKTNTGHYMLYTDYEALKTVVLNHYEAYKTGSLQSHAIGLQQYSRKSLTETLSKLL